MTETVVVYRLSGLGEKRLFVLPLRVHHWIQSCEPGEIEFPQDVAEDLDYFVSEEYLDDFKNTMTTTWNFPGNVVNDLALMLGRIVHNYDKERELQQDIILREWEVSEDEYQGEIY